MVSSAWQEAEQIVLDAIERGIKAAEQESAKIIAEAKQKAERIIGEAGGKGMAAEMHLSNMIRPGNWTEHSYEQIDDLFVRMRHYLAKITKSDPVAADELKGLVAQLEYWVDSLVVDSLKLKSLEGWLQRTTEMAKRLRAKLDRK